MFNLEHNHTTPNGDWLICIHGQHWGFDVIAIPDSGEWIHRKFVDYTPDEIIDILTGEIDGLV